MAVSGTFFLQAVLYKFHAGTTLGYEVVQPYTYPIVGRPAVGDRSLPSGEGVRRPAHRCV
jgi:hypothetical protein